MLILTSVKVLLHDCVVSHISSSPTIRLTFIPSTTPSPAPSQAKCHTGAWEYLRTFFAVCIDPVNALAAWQAYYFLKLKLCLFVNKFCLFVKKLCSLVGFNFMGDDVAPLQENTGQASDGFSVAAEEIPA